jgi:hypothetical protein
MIEDKESKAMVKWNSPDDVPVGEKSTRQVLFATSRTYDAVEVGSSKGRTYFIVYAMVGMKDVTKGWHIRQIDNPDHKRRSATPGVEMGVPIVDSNVYTLSEGIQKAQSVLHQIYND